MHGQFVWYELTTPDVDGAQKFYQRFTKWGTQAFDKDYMMWTSGGVPRAGIFRLTDEMRKQGVPPNWMPYVESDDVDATARKAKSLGGTIVVPPDDIPGTGRFAVLRDPQGATFGIYKSAHMSNAWGGTPEVDRFSWHELMTTDYTKAFEFYRALFNWKNVGEMDMGGGSMYLMAGHGEAMYAGIFNRMPDMANVPPFWLVYIHVKDVAKAVAAATKGGATIVRPRMEIPGGTIAILSDPQGAGFAVHDLMTMPGASAPVAAKIAEAGTAVTSSVKSAVKAVKKAARKVAKEASKVSSRIKSKVKAKVSRTTAAKPRTKAKPKAKARGTVARKAPARSGSSARATPKTKARSSAKKSSGKRASARRR
jgi:uncharacterized protein